MSPNKTGNCLFRKVTGSTLQSRCWRQLTRKVILHPSAGPKVCGVSACGGRQRFLCHNGACIHASKLQFISSFFSPGHYALVEKGASMYTGVKITTNLRATVSVIALIILSRKEIKPRLGFKVKIVKPVITTSPALFAANFMRPRVWRLRRLRSWKEKGGSGTYRRLSLYIDTYAFKVSNLPPA